MLAFKTRQVVFPIESIKSQVLTSLAQHPLTLLVAPPGAGKSTVLPLWLLEKPTQGKTLLLQPRRVAAKNIALYLAKQLGEPVGQRIGYRLRNDTKVSSATELEVITEGVLIRLMQADPELSDVSCILFDEFHERSSQADFAFALARDIQDGLRDDLKLMLMSATLATQELTEQLPNANVLISEGKSHPVEIAYAPCPTQQFWRDHLIQCTSLAVSQHTGTALVFLPGRADIEKVAQALAQKLPNLEIACLFGDMPLADQQEAISPAQSGSTKVVLATNIAETSLTIDGVNLVIDSGLEKQAIFDQNTQTNRLSLTKISQASAIQRAGRAGRLMAGKCLRLYGQSDFERMAKHSPLAMLQADIVPIALEASRWGVAALKQLPLLTLPKAFVEQQAWQTLAQLGLTDTHHKLTKHGDACAKLSCHPRFAHMIERAYQAEIAGETGFTLLACIVAAMLEQKDIFSASIGRNNASLHQRIDYLINQGEKRFGFIFKQIKQLFARYQGECQSTYQQLPISLTGVLVAWAFPERIAKARNQQGSYVSLFNKGYQLDHEDTLCEHAFLAVAQLSQVEQKLTIRIACPISLEQIKQWQLAKQYTELVCAYDAKLDKITANECQLLEQLVISRAAQSQALTQESVAQLWRQQIAQQGLAWLAWSEAAEQVKLRWQWLNRFQPQLGLPELTEPYLLAELDTWLLPYASECQSKKALDRLKLEELLLHLLDYQQQQLLEKLAPTYYVGPTGRKCRITYDLINPPKVSLPMQEIYGLAQSPQIGDIDRGKGVGLVLELMSPANRPIQITSDLSQFWQGSYKAVQKDMKASYPKHYWPDDPANAVPTNKTKRFIKN
ncbi:ATP-dependent helicase HrpB [Thalassotalea sp. LPB0316]|uniref:ATP-dependent helicase HrpB n=1 Tax=Thalassotalea sp. LPB0316 TaxID=2769490 RepID=UPI0018662BB1|nr:ATP-dependent helicase HrpB [Thalassotalea sp. LPB0316]QOL26709.1 ATP-dependent helicase HrpB [Thalassotalea sp. LPB0316]